MGRESRGRDRSGSGANEADFGSGEAGRWGCHPSAAGRGMHARQVIINADDFGMSAEIDRGILEAHDRGVVTSASLMVNEPDAEAAIDQARRRPGVSLGIHVAFDRRGQWFVDVEDLAAVRRELDHQLARFVRLTWMAPSHIDSHHHVHRAFKVARLLLEAGERYGVPVWGFSDVFYVGRFYGQPEFRKTDLSVITGRDAHLVVAVTEARRVGGVLASGSSRDEAGCLLQPRA